MFNSTNDLRLINGTVFGCKNHKLVYFSKPTRNGTTRFINFTFGPLVSNSRFNWHYKYLFTSGSFVSRKNSVCFSGCGYSTYSEFCWLLFYKFRIRLGKKRSVLFSKRSVKGITFSLNIERVQYGKLRLRVNRVGYRLNSFISNNLGIYYQNSTLRTNSFRGWRSSYYYRSKSTLLRFRLFNALLLLHKNKLPVDGSGDSCFFGLSYTNTHTLSGKINQLVVITDPSLIYAYLSSKRLPSFFDMSPNRYIQNILSLSKSRITPFAIKGKTFISQREVHYSAICFFIEKGSFVYKNSYFLGLVIGGKKLNNYLPIKVFKLFNYSFYKNPYVLTQGLRWL